MFKKNGSMSGMQPTSTIIIIIPMIFGNHGVLQSIFANDNEFKEYMKVKGAVSEDIFDFSLILELKSSYQIKVKNIFLNYLRNEIHSYLQFDEDFDRYLNNDGVEDGIRDENIHNLNDD